MLKRDALVVHFGQNWNNHKKQRRYSYRSDEFRKDDLPLIQYL